MVLWIAFAALTAVVLAFLVLPLLRRGRELDARADYDLNVYRDQLLELERDVASGAIGKTEADGARAEISRRMLAADSSIDSASTSKSTGANWFFLVALGAVPVITLVGYLMAGAPGYSDVPRAERIANAMENNDMPALVVQVENHLAANPKDVQGWLVLAPVYRRLGRFQDAADAFGKAIELNERSAQLYTEYGETLVLANEGEVVSQARQAFAEALELDKNFIKARFYQGVAQAQDGNKQAALQTFESLLQNAPANAPWHAVVKRQIAALQKPAKGPDQEQVEAAAQMTDEQRQTMIRGMVDGLAERLEQDGKDLDGWLRLINARMVLGEQDKATEALGSARENFKDDEAALARLANVATKLGLN